MLSAMLSISFTASGETIVNSDGDIQASFTLDTEAAYIGQPYTIHYELSGGSGVFNDVTVQAMFPRGTRTCYGGFSEKVNAGSGECTITATDGKAISIQLVGYDSSGKYFYIDMGEDIPLLPNPDLPVNLSFDKTSVTAGESLTVSYTVSSCTGFTGTASWTIGEKRQYWDEYSQNLEEQNLSSSSGTLSFTPYFGDYAYLVLMGEDQQGRAVYIESEPIAIRTSLPTAGTVFLPADLTHIESQAFLGIAATRVVVPATVTSIVDDAFSGSSIQIVYGSTDCVKTYAQEHHLDYISLD